MPRGFESGLRYLAPALVLGLALLPTRPAAAAPRAAVELCRRIAAKKLNQHPLGRDRAARGYGWTSRRCVLAVAVGYPVQRHYLQDRYSGPGLHLAPGLNAAFAWARDVSGARIATTSTRQYPLFGTDLSNQVQYVGVERPTAASNRRPPAANGSGSWTKATTTTSSSPATA